MKRSRAISVVSPIIEAVEFTALALSLLILVVAFWSVFFLAGHFFNGLTR